MPYTDPILLITTRLIVTQYHQVALGETGEKVFAINGPDECMQRSVPEAIQELIELNGFLCFLFRSTYTKYQPLLSYTDPEHSFITS